MQTQADAFKALNTELIFIFREEKEGPDGLKKIKDRSKTSYTLAVDLNKASTRVYSTKKMTFDNFVINKNGKVHAVIPGTLKDRATADLLLKHLGEIEKK